MKDLEEVELASAQQAVKTGLCPPWLAPFWPLRESHAPLFGKLTQDRRLETYSIYGLFTGSYQLVYGDDPPSITFSGRSRGQVALLNSADGGLVVKPVQSGQESSIAAIAGTLGVGPQQFPSLPGFLTEELVTGQFFTELPAVSITPERMAQIGQNLGQLLARLHSRSIIYNDATLSDQEGRSHLLVSPDASCRLIDFGISVSLERHPQLGPEEVYNLARTMPMFRLFAGMGTGREGLKQFLGAYRRQLAGTSPEELMQRDLKYADEGLRMAAVRRLSSPSSPDSPKPTAEVRREKDIRPAKGWLLLGQ